MSIIENAKKWLEVPFDEETRKKVQNLIDENSTELQDAFYKSLEFGTGGMRGIMGVGTNRLNPYTLGLATQGLANYLNQVFVNQEIKVAIAYDVRHNSKEFAKVVADVLTANGIQVLLFKEHRPTPELSFTVRDKGCQAGIVLTASHNPPEYNGYKVYWNDGAQIVPPNDENIIKEINHLSFEDINFNGNENLILWIEENQDEVYIDACIENSLYQKVGKDKLNIVFTSIHGTTYTTIPKALKKAGFTRVNFVEEQMIPSGNFPSVESPNPEEVEALSMAINLGEMTSADLVIGCDPDGDRLGIAVRNLEGKLQLLNGNQTNTILTHYILTQWKNQGKITGNEFIGSTIVTSDIFLELARRFGVVCKTGLTGFKWIGKMIKDAEGKEKFICGGEESFGFMTGDFVRDKDSCGSILLACEVAAWCKDNGKTMFDYLLEIYSQTGIYYETLCNLVKKGQDGEREIKQMMEDYRNSPAEVLANSKVIKIDDYKDLISWNLQTGEKKNIIDMPKSNVLIYYTEDGTKVAIRPSGTEPKIKFYFSVQHSFSDGDDFEKIVKYLEEEKINRIKKDLKI